MEVVKKCQNCKRYNPVKGEPPAGWCLFIAQEDVPFWMQNYTTAIEKLGADVMGDDGADCPAFQPGC